MRFLVLTRSDVVEANVMRTLDLGTLPDFVKVIMDTFPLAVSAVSSKAQSLSGAERGRNACIAD